MATIIDWCEQLPAQMVSSIPDLGLSYAWALLLVGRLDRAEEMLAEIEAQVQKIPNLLGQTAAAQAFLARSRGNNVQVIEKSKVALALLAENDEISRGNLAINLGLVYWHEGRLSEAEKCWRRVNSPHLVALVHAGVEFPDGKTRILPEMPEEAKQAVLKVQEDAADLASIHNI